MKKIILSLLLLFIAITIYSILPGINLTGNAIHSNFHAYSTAICDENNYCEDYYVECSDNLLQKLSATGFSIQQDSNWKDSRNKTEFCN